MEPDRVSQPHNYGKKKHVVYSRRCAGGMSLARDGKRSCVGDLLKRARVFNPMDTEDGRNFAIPVAISSLTRLFYRV